MRTNQPPVRVSGSSTKSPIFAYPVHNTLCLNLTTECTNACYFCYRQQSDMVAGYNLRIQSFPNASELIYSIQSPRKYKEVVFSGYGEPTIRFGVIKQVAKWVKEHSGVTRLVTNGQGNLIHVRNIVPDMVGLIDAISISLPADTADRYNKICKPIYGPETFYKVLDFIKESVKSIPKVEVITLPVPGNNPMKVKEIAEGLGAEFRCLELDRNT